MRDRRNSLSSSACPPPGMRSTPSAAHPWSGYRWRGAAAMTGTWARSPTGPLAISRCRLTSWGRANTLRKSMPTHRMPRSRRRTPCSRANPSIAARFWMCTWSPAAAMPCGFIRPSEGRGEDARKLDRRNEACASSRPWPHLRKYGCGTKAFFFHGAGLVAGAGRRLRVGCACAEPLVGGQSLLWQRDDAAGHGPDPAALSRRCHPPRPGEQSRACARPRARRSRSWANATRRCRSFFLPSRSPATPASTSTTWWRWVSALL